MQGQQTAFLLNMQAQKQLNSQNSKQLRTFNPGNVETNLEIEMAMQKNFQTKQERERLHSAKAVSADNYKPSKNNSSHRRFKKKRASKKPLDSKYHSYNLHLNEAPSTYQQNILNPYSEPIQTLVAFNEGRYSLRQNLSDNSTNVVIQPPPSKPLNVRQSRYNSRPKVGNNLSSLNGSVNSNFINNYRVRR